MSPSIDVWLRGTAHATTVALPEVPANASEWTDADVTRLLEGMLRAVERERNPGGDVPPVTLRGFSWIVNPFEGGGVVVAIEMQSGAAVAGPFTIEEPALTAAIRRVVAAPGAGAPSVH